MASFAFGSAIVVAVAVHACTSQDLRQGVHRYGIAIRVVKTLVLQVVGNEKVSVRTKQAFSVGGPEIGPRQPINPIHIVLAPWSRSLYQPRVYVKHLLI